MTVPGLDRSSSAAAVVGEKFAPGCLSALCVWTAAAAGAAAAAVSMGLAAHTLPIPTQDGAVGSMQSCADAPLPQVLRTERAQCRGALLHS